MVDQPPSGKDNGKKNDKNGLLDRFLDWQNAVPGRCWTWLVRNWNWFWGKVECKPWRTQQQYMEDRVQHKINQYTKKARRYKWLYWVMTGVAAIGAVTVPLLIGTKDETVTIPILASPISRATVATIVSLIVGVLIALESVFHSREHWRNYDTISSVLRGEEMYFSTKAGAYTIGADQMEEVVRKLLDEIGKNGQFDEASKKQIENAIKLRLDEAVKDKQTREAVKKQMEEVLTKQAEEAVEKKWICRECKKQIIEVIGKHLDKMVDNPLEDKVFRLFVERVETAIATERAGTIGMRTKPPDK